MKRIAIIEDHEATRATLQVILAEEGYDALLIQGPGDLLATLAAARPDLVLLDFMLGTWGDGLTLAGALRADPLLMQVPIIMLSAAPTLLQQHALEFAALRCHLLTKPFDLDELLAVIAGALASDQS